MHLYVCLYIHTRIRCAAKNGAVPGYVRWQRPRRQVGEPLGTFFGCLFVDKPNRILMGRRGLNRWLGTTRVWWGSIPAALQTNWDLQPNHLCVKNNQESWALSITITSKVSAAWVSVETIISVTSWLGVWQSLDCAGACSCCRGWCRPVAFLRSLGKQSHGRLSLRICCGFAFRMPFQVGRRVGSSSPPSCCINFRASTDFHYQYFHICSVFFAKVRSDWLDSGWNNVIVHCSATLQATYLLVLSSKF